MRPSSCKSTLTVMRSVAGLTQQRLAELIRCSRMSIQQIELGRLKLSDKMAEKISFHTGIDMNWLLRGDYEAPPVCLCDSRLLYTREMFKRTRAEISRPRSHPLDARGLENFLAHTYHRLNAVGETAYHADKIIYFYYQTREFLEELEKQWPPSTKGPVSMDAAQTQKEFQARFEKIRRKKRPSKPLF